MRHYDIQIRTEETDFSFITPSASGAAAVYRVAFDLIREANGVADLFAGEQFLNSRSLDRIQQVRSLACRASLEEISE